MYVGLSRRAQAAVQQRACEDPTITFAGSKLHVLPMPVHVSHAPNGLLKENERGSNCGTLVPHSGHANFCEYKRSCAVDHRDDHQSVGELA